MQKNTIINTLVVVGIIAVSSSFIDFGSNENNPSYTNAAIVSSIDINQINKESENIFLGIMRNKDSRNILTVSVIDNFIINGVQDFDPKNESLLKYIQKNDKQIQILLKKPSTEHNRQQIEIRKNISLEINKNLKDIFNIITSYSSEIKQLNKQLLVLDFEIKEKISIWTFIAKENNIEDQMEKIINNLLKSEYSLENKLKFLFDGWLDNNTKNKLDIYFSIHEEFTIIKNNIKNINKMIEAKYPHDYQYSLNYINKLKNNK